jgi:pilus assembly protein CpaB
MNGKSLMMLALAVGFGLIAMLLTRQMLGQEPAKVEDVQDVLVAARDLKEEEILKPDAVKVVRMAKSAVPPGAFSTPKDVEERWVKTTLLEGDVVIDKKLGPKGTPPGLVANIPKGMRAFAIDVTEQSGVSGFILPGHHVDVIRYESDQGSQHAESILQNILVLASGQVFTRAEERSLTNRTVTLAVTPEQVAILVAARARGQLSLSLRGVNDHEVTARPKSQAAPGEAEEARWKAAEEKRVKLERELADLKASLAANAAATAPAPTSAPAPASPPARPPVRHVHIYRGGRSPDRIPLDGGTGAETGDRRTEPIPGLQAIDLPVRGGPNVGGPQAEATALIRQAAGSIRPGS